jgi:hypothetical protein
VRLRLMLRLRLRLMLRLMLRLIFKIESRIYQNTTMESINTCAFETEGGYCPLAQQYISSLSGADMTGALYSMDTVRIHYEEFHNIIMGPMFSVEELQENRHNLQEENRLLRQEVERLNIANAGLTLKVINSSSRAPVIDYDHDPNMFTGCAHTLKLKPHQVYVDEHGATILMGRCANKVPRPGDKFCYIHGASRKAKNISRPGRI